MYIEFLIQLVAAWYKSRSVRNLALLAIATFSMPLAAFAFVLVGYFTSTNTVYATCMELVSETVDVDGDDALLVAADQADEIRVPLRRILQLGKSNERVVFVVAAQLGRQGRLKEAIRKMREIAPAGERGFPPAHDWLARVTIAAGRNAAEEERKALLNDLAIAESSMAILPPELTAVYTDQLVKTGEAKKALDILRSRAQQQPGLDPMLLRLATALDQRDDAREAAQRVEAAIESDYADQPKDEAYFLRKVDVERYSNDLERLLALVLDGLTAFPESERLRRVHAELMLIAQRPGSTTGEQETASGRLARIRRAFDIDPQSPSVLTLIAQEMANGTDVPDDLRAGLAKALQEGKAPPEAQFIIANLMLLTGKSGGANSAIPLFASASRNANLSAAAINNLAFALLQIDEPNIDGALELLDRALSVQGLPDSSRASIFDTQGDARAMKGDDTGAVESYERALDLVSTKINSREKLAALYSKLGMKDLASGQLKLIEKIKQEASIRP